MFVIIYCSCCNRTLYICYSGTFLKVKRIYYFTSEFNNHYLCYPDLYQRNFIFSFMTKHPSLLWLVSESAFSDLFLFIILLLYGLIPSQPNFISSNHISLFACISFTPIPLPRIGLSRNSYIPELRISFPHMDPGKWIPSLYMFYAYI